jgi:aspartyl-tRNA synthetase
MAGLRRSHAAGEVTAALVGSEVVVGGWVQHRRDHGGVVFVDLRDRDGLVQVVFKPDTSPECHERAGQLRAEYVILARGTVQRRSPETVNPKLPTGEVEVIATELRLLNRATPPPFPIEEETEADEATRLRHRIHDLRRPPLQRALRTRHRLYQAVRRSLAELDFLEIETPMLAKSTPEGARDFLVPSRHHPGSFYALPQSPQIMKQLLMVAGYDRYFQIARCFRDEDQRADRQLEFTQVDLEMSFASVEDILEVLEEVTVAACSEAAGLALPRPFRRMPYADAMGRYGCDRPDTRIQLELVDLTDAFADSGFRAFRAVVDGGGIVKCLPVHDADALSRGQIDRLESLVRKELGGKGLAWIPSPSDTPSGRGPGRVPGASCSSRPTSARGPTPSSRACASISDSASPGSTAASGRCSSWWTSRCSSPTRAAPSPTSTSPSWRPWTRTCPCSRARPTR